jgi:hypothetical protein
MTKTRLLSTVAAATLLLSVGAASAQNSKKDEAPAPAPAVQRQAPAEKIAPAMKPGEQKAGVKPSGTVGQAPKASGTDKTRATDKGAMDKNATGKSSDKGPAVKNTAESKHPSDANGSANIKAKSENGAAAKSTTGQGAASGSAKLSTEQHAKITSIIKQQKVAPVKLNVTVRVGTRVPDSVRFHRLPAEVFVVYPEWRGYDYILVGNEILVIDPRSHQIVAILDA